MPWYDDFRFIGGLGFKTNSFGDDLRGMITLKDDVVVSGDNGSYDTPYIIDTLN